MPSPSVVRRFVSLVEAGEFVRAMEEFYANDASVQENAKPPRAGKATLIAHECGVLATMKQMRAHPARSVVVDGDTVVIRWIFDMTDASGVTRRLDEVALQEWRGEHLVRERFFYDPASIVVVNADDPPPA